MRYVRRNSYSNYLAKRKSHIVLGKLFYAILNRINSAKGIDENLREELKFLMEMANPHLDDIVEYFKEER
jgi:hypothetical protein